MIMPLSRENKVAKIKNREIFWVVTYGLGFLVIVLSLLSISIFGPDGVRYDEQAHRSEITRIYPSVEWPEYRDAAREICGLDEGAFRHVRSLAADEGPEAEQAMKINVAYLCPGRS